MGDANDRRRDETNAVLPRSTFLPLLSPPPMHLLQVVISSLSLSSSLSSSREEGWGMHKPCWQHGVFARSTR